MAASAIRPEYYFIVQQNVHPESGYPPDHRGRLVRLNALDRQADDLLAERAYVSVTAVAMTDVAGNALASPLLGMGGVVIDPRTAQFPGSPPRDWIPAARLTAITTA